jgi:Fe-S-cluster-containing dehydrogenase component/CRP-like cAMP-binding protein
MNDLDELFLGGETAGTRDEDGQLIRYDRATREQLDQTVTIVIDGEEVTVPLAVPKTDAQGTVLRDKNGLVIPRPTTVLDAFNALRSRLSTQAPPVQLEPIPVLCHQEHMEPVAVCRVCAVRTAQFRKRANAVVLDSKLSPACQLRVAADMIVYTHNEHNGPRIAQPKDKEGKPDVAKAAEERDNAAQSRRMVRDSLRVLTGLLAADHLPASGPQPFNELARLAERFAPGATPYHTERRPQRQAGGAPGNGAAAVDHSSRLITVHHDECILCDRCVRACDTVKENFVIGRNRKGYHAQIGFDLGDAMGESSCVACGECMLSCPTGALTLNRDRGVIPELPERLRPVRGRLRHAASVPTVEDLQRIPLFASLPYKQLEWFIAYKSIIRRELSPGDVLARQGEYGTDAFVLLDGAFDVHVAAEDRAARDRTFTLTKDELILGEMTCLNDQPRTATVTARTAGVVLAIRRNVLHYLERTRASRRLLDGIYRRRAIENFLKRFPLFLGLADAEREACLAHLLGWNAAQEQARDGGARPRLISLVRTQPGGVIVREGEAAEDLYLVRIGNVKAVREEGPGRERVLRRLGRDECFGEIGVLSRLNVPGLLERLPVERFGRSTATVRALDHAELLRVPAAALQGLFGLGPSLRARLEERALQSIAALEAPSSAPDHGERLLADFLDQGLYNAQRMFVFDLTRCTRCDECTRACADSHGDGVTRLLREGLRFGDYLVGTSCRSCTDPYCMDGCPVDSIHREGATLNIRIESHCIGCGLCERNCPYGNIEMLEVDDRNRPVGYLRDRAAAAEELLEVNVLKGDVVRQANPRLKANTCDLCEGLVRPGKKTYCVYACPHDAAFRVDGDQLWQMVQRRLRG